LNNINYPDKIDEKNILLDKDIIRSGREEAIFMEKTFKFSLKH